MLSANMLNYYVAFQILGVVILLWLLNRTLYYIYEHTLEPIVFPRIMKTFARVYNSRMDRVKRQLFSDLSNLKKAVGSQLTILEIGAGTGANFKYYPDGTSVIPLEPMDNFGSYLKDNAKEFPNLTVEKLVVAFGEDMKDIPSESVDAVVTTLVLCSVKEVTSVHGKYYFLEHVGGEKYSVGKFIQHLVQVPWAFLLGNCILTRNIQQSIEEMGFSSMNCQQIVAPLPLPLYPMLPHVVGFAVK
ncbi:thiol S-methyltransferase TMT1A-like [Ptychodera flava]|uniref:thiol S-methyltransferase TMT1A-like n=1 Tax=Ptychodera flava TaxID=63121 RepID=UPI00396A3F2D